MLPDPDTIAKANRNAAAEILSASPHTTPREIEKQTPAQRRQEMLDELPMANRVPGEPSRHCAKAQSRRLLHAERRGICLCHRALVCVSLEFFTACYVALRVEKVQAVGRHPICSLRLDDEALRWPGEQGISVRRKFFCDIFRNETVSSGQASHWLTSPTGGRAGALDTLVFRRTATINGITPWRAVKIPKLSTELSMDHQLS